MTYSKLVLPLMRVVGHAGVLSLCWLHIAAGQGVHTVHHLQDSRRINMVQEQQHVDSL